MQMREIISSEQFLELWDKDNTTDAILEVEAYLIDEKIMSINSMLKHIVEEKKQVSGGDDWHDGAFRATDSAANNLVEQGNSFAKALNWKIVRSPDSNLEVATLGSRVVLKQNHKFVYAVDVVGMSLLHAYGDEDVSIASLKSPIGKALVDKSVGQEFSAILGNGRQDIEILEAYPSPSLKMETRI